MAGASPSDLCNMASSATLTAERQRSVLAKFIAIVAPEQSQQLASALLAEFHTLNRICSQSKESLARICGKSSAVPGLLLGARALMLEGSRGELGKRIIDPGDQKLLRHLIATMGSLQDETLRILFLDGIGRLIADEQVQRGTVHQLVIYPRPIFRRAMEHNAASLILVHNHPSGDATPSEEDLIATRALVQISRSLDIEIVEHIVVTNSECRRIMKSRPRPNTTAKSAGQHLRDSASDRSSSEQARTDQALANARRAVRRRLLRQQLFGSPEILGEPAWDMLVELFIHECEDKPISTGSLCGAVERPLSSAMRVLQKLCDAELIYRAEDPSDGRRQFVRLAPSVAHRLHAYFSEGGET